MRTGAVYLRQANTCWPIFYFLPAERMMRQRRPLFHSQTRGLMLPTSCWKRSLQHNTCSGDVNRNVLPAANKYLFCRSFTFYERRERRGKRHPLFHLQTRGLILPASCWKRSLQHSTCNEDANRSGLPAANKYLLTDFLLSTSGEGDEVTSPSFETR